MLTNAVFEVESDDFVAVSQEVERKAILTSLEQLEDWLFDAGANANAETYRAKKNETDVLLAPAVFRQVEITRRPAAITRCKNELKQLDGLYTKILNSTAHGNHTAEAKTAIEKEAGELKARLDATGKWVEEKSELQKGIKPYETPALNSEEIAKKMQELAKEAVAVLKKANVTMAGLRI